MNLDRVLKYVWLVCGVMLLILLLAGAFSLLGIGGWFSGSHQERGVAVNNAVTERAEKVRLDLTYNLPEKIENSEFYFLRVFISYNGSNNLNAGLDSYSKNYELYQPSNIVFLDKDFKVVRSLLSAKALITDFRYPQSQIYNDYDEQEKDLKSGEMKFMVYQIAFNDSDKDGQIDNEDDSDLYISGLDGSNLTQITKDWNIINIEFYDNYKTILICYSNRLDKNQTKHFATYTVATKELNKLVNIDQELKTIEQVLIK